MTENKKPEEHELVELEEEQSKSEKETEENVDNIKDQLLRALAEMENIRKRAAREKEEAGKYAITSFARSLLTVADNLHRALIVVSQLPTENLPKEVQSFIEGVQLTEADLLTTFEKNGIKKISPLGEIFDHSYHQAMFEVENAEQSAGTIVEVLQPGYVLNDRLLRPAMVGVARAPSDNS